MTVEERLDDLFDEDCEHGEWPKAPMVRNECRKCVAEHIRAAVAQAVKAERERAWKPIATAPKDGREVLLRVKRRAGMPGGCLVGHYMPGGHCIEDHPAIDPGWYFWNGCMFDAAAEPTHWAPLPDDAAIRGGP